MESESLETVGVMASTFEDPLHLQSILKTKPDSSPHILEQPKGRNNRASDSKVI